MAEKAEPVKTMGEGEGAKKEEIKEESRQMEEPSREDINKDRCDTKQTSEMVKTSDIELQGGDSKDTERSEGDENMGKEQVSHMLSDSASESNVDCDQGKNGKESTAEVEKKKVECEEVDTVEGGNENSTVTYTTEQSTESEVKNTASESMDTEIEVKDTASESMNTKVEVTDTELESKDTEKESKNTEKESKSTELESKDTELEVKDTELEVKDAEKCDQAKEMDKCVHEIDAKSDSDIKDSNLVSDCTESKHVEDSAIKSDHSREPSIHSCDSLDNNLDRPIPTNPILDEEESTALTDDYYEEVEVKKCQTDSSCDFSTSTPEKEMPKSKSANHLIGNANLMGSTSALPTSPIQFRGRVEEEEEEIERERGKKKLMNSRAVSSSQPVLGMSTLRKIRSSFRMPNFKKSKDKLDKKSPLKANHAVEEKTIENHKHPSSATTPGNNRSSSPVAEIKLRKKSVPNVQTRMSSMFKRFSMGALNMDIVRIKGKDSRYRSSESLESFSSLRSGQSSLDNLDSKVGGSRDSSVSGQGHSRCNSIDELDEGIYDTVDVAANGAASGYSRKLGDRSKNETSAVGGSSSNIGGYFQSSIKPQRPQSCIEIGSQHRNSLTVEHNELGYALVEKRGGKMHSKEDESSSVSVVSEDSSKSIYLLAGEVVSRENSFKIKDEYSEPKDRMPDGSPVVHVFDESGEDYSAPCDSLTETSTKKSLDSSMDDIEDEVYEEIDVDGKRQPSIKKKRPLKRSVAEDRDDEDVSEGSDDGVIEEVHYETIPELQRNVSNPYHSIVDPEKSVIDPYQTIKDVKDKIAEPDSDEGSAPVLPPKPQMEPPYVNSPRLPNRSHRQLPPIPDKLDSPTKKNSDVEVPPPVPPRNISTGGDESYQNVEERPPQPAGPPPRPPRHDTSFEKRAVLDRMERESMLYDGEEDDMDDYIDDFTDDDCSEEDAADGEEKEEEEIYANMKPLASEEIEDSDKLHHVVNELKATEQVYVEKLEMLLKTRQKTANLLGSDVARLIFPNIDSMCALHRENILPHLQERDTMWKSNKKVGDIMAQFCPYLKLYTDYVKNFDSAMKLLDHWQGKSREFSRLLRTVQIKSASHSMRIQIKSHMLEPITRVPRYELLLKQYLKYLPPDSDDRCDVERALKLVSEAALHFESMMNHEDQMGKISEIQKLIDMPIFSPSRRFIKEGRLCKFHATSGKMDQRYMYLFNDKLVLCKEKQYSIPGMAKYNVRQMMDLEGMQVLEGDNMEAQHTFYIKTKQKALELGGSNAEESAEWQQAIWRAVGDKVRAKMTRKTFAEGPSSKNPRITLIEMDLLGKEAPVWIHNSQVSMCMCCARDFSSFTRKHHCRACGSVICSNCSRNELALDYDKNKEHRVCDDCNEVLTKHNDISIQRPSLRNFKKRSQEISLHRGFLHIMPEDKTTFTRRWFEIHEEGTLYVYKAQQDIIAMSYLPLSKVEALPVMVNLAGETVIRIEKEDKVYYLKDESMEVMIKWLDALKTAIENARSVSRRNSSDTQKSDSIISEDLKPPEFKPIRKSSSLTGRKSGEFPDGESCNSIESIEEDDESEENEEKAKDENVPCVEGSSQEEDAKSEDSLDVIVKLDTYTEEIHCEEITVVNDEDAEELDAQFNELNKSKKEGSTDSLDVIIEVDCSEVDMESADDLKTEEEVELRNMEKKTDNTDLEGKNIGETDTTKETQLTDKTDRDCSCVQESKVEDKTESESELDAPNEGSEQKTDEEDSEIRSSYTLIDQPEFEEEWVVKV